MAHEESFRSRARFHVGGESFRAVHYAETGDTAAPSAIAVDT